MVTKKLKNLRSQKFIKDKNYLKRINKEVDYSKILDPDRSRRVLLCWALGCIVVIRFLTIGLYPLMDKTEARYAEIAREMVVTNNWITPQLDSGVPFWGKPPLSFWLTALSYKVFGVNEFAARFPSVVLAIITAWLIFILGSKLKDTLFGLMSALILFTTGLFFVNAGSVMTDPALVLATTLSMVSFAMIFLDEEFKGRWSYLFFVGLGFSFIAKGPVGWVLTFIPLVLWCAVHNQWKKVFQGIPWVSGAVLTLAIAMPWYILAEHQTPGFLEYFFIGEHWQRFTVSSWQGDMYGSGHAQHKGMIWFFIVPATFPWIVIVLAKIVQKYKQGQKIKNLKNDIWLSYLFFWFLSPMILFTLASNILITYVIPSLPAFALLTGFGLRQKEESSGRILWMSFSTASIVATVFVPLSFLVAIVTIVPSIGRDNSQISIAKMFNQSTKGREGSLIYISEMPHSAEFYTNGNAVEWKSVSDERIFREFNDDNEDCFVIKQNELNKLSTKTLGLMRKIGTASDYLIFKEK